MKPKDEMTPDEYDVWFEGLSKPEKLADVRKFRAEVTSRHRFKNKPLVV